MLSVTFDNIRKLFHFDGLDICIITSISLFLALFGTYWMYFLDKISQVSNYLQEFIYISALHISFNIFHIYYIIYNKGPAIK